MSGTPTACFVDVNGIHAPAYNDILTYLQAQLRGVFGSDLYLGNDSQDGQMLGIFALAIADVNSLAVAVYNAYSPATAQGLGLSSVVKINGIARLIPTNSTVDVTCIGVAGSTIVNGVITDQNNNSWSLPATVVIPLAGQITVTATAQSMGAIPAASNTVTGIATPTLGWQSVTNPQAAVEGSPLETDVQLRQRQTTSTMLPSVTALDGMIGAVAAVTHVTRFQCYENDTSLPDANAIPGHTISFVVEGGDVTEIATAIAAHKTPGAGTYGTTTVAVLDPYGVPHNIRFYSPPVYVPVTVVIHLTPRIGYTSVIGTEILTAVYNFINANPIGQNVFLSKVITMANIAVPDTNTFNITSVLMAANGGTPAMQDIPLAFYQAATVGASLATATITIAIP